MCCIHISSSYLLSPVFKPEFTKSEIQTEQKKYKNKNNLKWEAKSSDININCLQCILNPLRKNKHWSQLIQHVNIFQNKNKLKYITLLSTGVLKQKSR